MSRDPKCASCVLVATALVALGVLAPPALAKKHRAIASKVTIEFFTSDISIDQFDGIVTSRRPECADQRLVKVWRKAEGGDEVVGSSYSSQGPEAPWYFVQSNPGSGTYYATLKRKKISHGTCGPARSKSIDVVDDPNVG